MENISKNGKLIGIALAVLAVIVIIFVLYNSSNKNQVPDEPVVQDNFRNIEYLENQEAVDEEDEEDDVVNDIDMNPQSLETPPVVPDEFDRKMMTRNSAQNGVKLSSYNEGQRLQTGDWSSNYDQANNVIPDRREANNEFIPMESNSDGYAQYSGQGLQPDDLFDADKMLPQEVNDDWFQVTPDPISVKNRHLINTTRPIGVNTIGTSLRNASYDIRGTPPNPKHVVSPFLNSSIEPDHNIRPNFC